MDRLSLWVLCGSVYVWVCIKCMRLDKYFVSYLVCNMLFYWIFELCTMILRKILHFSICAWVSNNMYLDTILQAYWIFELCIIT